MFTTPHNPWWDVLLHTARWYHGSLLQNWNKDTLIPVQNFSGALKLNGIVSYRVLIMEMASRFTFTIWKRITQRQEWYHSSSKKPIFRTQPSEGKTATSATCAYLLSNLRPAIKFKWRGRLSKCFLMQHVNFQPHIAIATTTTIDDLQFQCLPHLPYSHYVQVFWACLDDSESHWEEWLSVRW